MAIKTKVKKAVKTTKVVKKEVTKPEVAKPEPEIIVSKPVEPVVEPTGTRQVKKGRRWVWI